MIQEKGKCNGVQSNDIDHLQQVSSNGYFEHMVLSNYKFLNETVSG